MYNYDKDIILKEIRFLATSRGDLRDFPPQVRQKAGFELDKIQKGNLPEDWKAMPSVGMGVKEIRIKEVDGIFRVMYVAKFQEAIYVLHCFQKKTQTTTLHDIALGRERFRALVNWRKQ